VSKRLTYRRTDKAVTPKQKAKAFLRWQKRGNSGWRHRSITPQVSLRFSTFLDGRTPSINLSITLIFEPAWWRQLKSLTCVTGSQVPPLKAFLVAVSSRIASCCRSAWLERLAHTARTHSSENFLTFAFECCL